jgi:hypothetical protein
MDNLAAVLAAADMTLIGVSSGACLAARSRSPNHAKAAARHMK